MTLKRTLTTGAVILVLMSLAWVMLGWNVLDSEKGSATARDRSAGVEPPARGTPAKHPVTRDSRIEFLAGPKLLVVDAESGASVQAQYRLRRAVGGLVMGGIRQSGNPDPDLLEGGWAVLEARAEGHVGFVTRREKVSEAGHVLRMQRAGRIRCLVQRAGKPVEGIRLALLPPAQRDSEWTGAWHGSYRPDALAGRRQQDLTSVSVSFGSVRVQSLLYRWENSLTTWLGTTDKEGRVAFTNIVPGDGYRIGLVSPVAVDRSLPPMTKLDRGEVLAGGAIRLDGGGDRRFTDKFSLTSGQEMSFNAELSGGRILGEAGSTKILVLHLFDTRVLPMEGQPEFKSYVLVGKPRITGQRFEYQQVSRGWKRLVLAWQDDAETVNVSVRNFEFGGGSLDLGRLRPSGRRLELSPAPEGALTSRLIQTEGFEIQLDLSMREFGGGRRNATIPIRWNLRSPLVIQGVLAGRCLVRIGELSNPEGHVLHVTPPKRISTLEDRSVPVSFEIRASRFVDIVAMGSVGRPLVDPVNFVSIFQGGSSQKVSVLPVEGRASLSLDIGAREIPMAVFAYCKPSMWKSGEIYAGGTVSGFLVKKQITAGSLALSLGEGDGATGVFRANRGQSLSNHAFNVWLLLDGVKRPVSIYTCVADAQGRFAVGGIPRGIRFAIANPEQKFQGKKTGLVIDPH